MSGSPHDKLEDLLDTRDTIMVAFAGFTALVWDHIITLDEEVAFIWKRDMGPVAYLFLLNRYLTPLGFIVNLVAYTLADWGIDTCRHFVRYEGAMTVIGIQIAGIIMFLRVRALYNQNKIVIWSIVLLFFVWLGVNAWLLTYGEAVYHVSGVHSCTMIFGTSPYIATASAWLPLLYDTTVFTLTLYKTSCRRGYLVRTLLSDGILYYSVLCLVNTVLTIMIARAGPGVKNITAQLELLLTVAMVSRITLNLRKQASEETIFFVSSNGPLWRPSPDMLTRLGAIGSTRKAGVPLEANTAPSTTPWWSIIARMARIRSRGNTVGSDASRRNDIKFRNASEHIQLSPIYPVSVRPKGEVAAVRAASPVCEEEPKVRRPGVEKDVEAAL